MQELNMHLKMHDALSQDEVLLSARISKELGKRAG